MGLHLCYELRLPDEATEDDAAARLAALRERALVLPFEGVSDVVRLTEDTLDGPPPLRTLAYERLEDVVHVSAVLTRSELYRRRLGAADDDPYTYTPVEEPACLPAVAVGFAVAPGRGSEPASLGVVRLSATEDAPPSAWWWHCCCKTQYASVVSDEHLVRCHTSLVTVLEHAAALGFELVVRDETGYWTSRDPVQLVANVAEMNRIVARLAGRFTDAMREAGGDSRQVGGAIFGHPDFERLETDERDE